jgi:hypothetical protein
MRRARGSAVCYDKGVRPSSLAPLLLAGPLFTTGCLHGPDADLDAAYAPEPPPPAEAVVRRDVTMQWEKVDEPAPALAASPGDRVAPDPIPFRIGAGHGALGSIDLTPCRLDGLQAGYMKMRVTFHRDGRVAHAVVESPLPPTQEALDCIAEQLESATVPTFDGRDASLTKRFFVEPGPGVLEPGDTVVHKKAPPPTVTDGAELTRR